MFCSVSSQKANAFLQQFNVSFYPVVTSFLALNSSEKVLPQIRRKLSAVVKFDTSATAQLMKLNSDGGKDRCERFCDEIPQLFFYKKTILSSELNLQN